MFLDPGAATGNESPIRSEEPAQRACFLERFKRPAGRQFPIRPASELRGIALLERLDDRVHGPGLAGRFELDLDLVETDATVRELEGHGIDGEFRHQPPGSLRRYHRTPLAVGLAILDDDEAASLHGPYGIPGLGR